MQCINGEIVLLPALPQVWPNGQVRGLRARGGFELDITWKRGMLDTLRLRGAPGGAAAVRYRGALRTVRVVNGRQRTLRAGDFRA
jgi:alpha-L-fucosidase 2